MCLEGTRIGLRQKILGLLGHANMLSPAAPAAPDKAKLVCLYGLAGSGKSSVANSIARTIENEAFYLSCFCCKRDDPDLSKPERVFPTLAYRIAQHDSNYRAALVSLLLSPRGTSILTASLGEQFAMLFDDLLPKVTAPSRTHMVVIDALDECGASAEQKQLATLLLSLINSVLWIRVFMMTRPVGDVIGLFRSSGGTSALLNINEENDMQQDISLFMTTRFRASNLEITPEQIDQLVIRSKGLFIWSSMLIKYVLSSRNPDHEILQFLSGEISEKPFGMLYALYDKVVEAAIGRKEDTEAIHAILGVILLSSGYRPLSASATAVFLRHNH